jgi:hypothetical protein
MNAMRRFVGPARVLERHVRTMPFKDSYGNLPFKNPSWMSSSKSLYEADNVRSFSTFRSKVLMFRAPTTTVYHDDDALSALPETISVTFITKDGRQTEVKARDGERALYLAHRHGIEMEGACEASLACTTWYVK